MLILKPYYDPNPPNEGGGTTTVDEKETQEYQTLTGKVETELTDVEKTRLGELKGKYDVVHKDDKGNVLTAEQIAVVKETEKKFNTILAKPEDQRTKEENDFIKANSEPEKVKSVYEQVDEVSGIKYNVEYGDTDPLSADGVILREEAIATHAAREYDKKVKTKFPDAYQYMLHLSQGGKREDFFKPENQDFKTLTIKKDDPANQERVLRIALTAKGNAPAIIDAAVNALKDGQLYEVAKSELEALQTSQQQREQRREQIEEQRKLKEAQDVDTFYNQLDEALEKGFDGIKIPITERHKFGDFFSSRIEYQNNGFMVTKPLNLKELNKELKVAYFEFTGGDLKGLTERNTKTAIASKFRSTIKQEFVPKGTGAATKQRVSMGEA